MGGELRVAEGVYRRASTAARQEESRTSFATQLVEVQPQADQTGQTGRDANGAADGIGQFENQPPLE